MKMERTRSMIKFVPENIDETVWFEKLLGIPDEYVIANVVRYGDVKYCIKYGSCEEKFPLKEVLLYAGEMEKT
jgi:hypothetical protein